MTNQGLAVESFATLTALRGKQFGKEIFTTILTFKELNDFLQVFPEVQRNANGRKVNSVKRYVLSGLDEGKPMRFFSSLTATARGHLYYEEANNRVAIDTAKSKLSINDGQHRLLGINEALKEIHIQLNKSKLDDEERETLVGKIEQLEGMSVPVMIFNNISVEEESQLFHDMNNLASRPSRSATIRLSQTDLLSKLAKELAQTNDYLQLYGVEMDKTNIRENNINTVLLTTVYECTRMVLTYVSGTKSELNEGNYEIVKKLADDLFHNVFEVLPKDIDVKGRYIIGKGYTLRSIFTFILNNLRKEVPQEKIFEAIRKQKWNDSIEVWEQYGGRLQPNGSVNFVGQRGGFNGVIQALEEQLAKL